MMKIDVQNLCADLDKLLEDICDFLLDEANNKNLTEAQRLFANNLIERSKKQLQQISKVSLALSKDVNDTYYVDMNRLPAVQEETEYDEADESIKCPSLSAMEPQTCPYENLPATEVEQCEKFGYLDKKGRFLFIGHQKRVIAGIKNCWLLIYGGKKDSKPVECINLCLFEAKPTVGDKTKSFELICRTTQKSFQFIASTPKDMMQWVSFINRKSANNEDTLIVNTLPSEDEENSYEPLKEIDDKNKIETVYKLYVSYGPLKKITKPLPPLPPEPKKLDHLPKNDSVINGEEEEDPTYSELDLSILKKINNELQQPSKQNHNNTNLDEKLSLNTTDDLIYDYPEQSALNKPKFMGNNTESQSNYYNTDDIKQKSDVNKCSQAPSELDETDDIYDMLEQPISKPSPKKPVKDIPPRIAARNLDTRTNSFSEDEEEQTYDIPEKPLPPDKFRSKPSLKPMVNEPEAEEYCRLLPNKSNIDKVFPTTKPNITKIDRKQISKSETKILRIGTLDKDKNAQKKSEDIYQNEEVEENYDCLCAPANLTISKNMQFKISLEALESAKIKKTKPCVPMRRKV